MEGWGHSGGCVRGGKVLWIGGYGWKDILTSSCRRILFIYKVRFIISIIVPVK